MNCLKCELTRARLMAAFAVNVGRQTKADTAAMLSKIFGETYYVGEDDMIYRKSKLFPYQSHSIYPKG